MIIASSRELPWGVVTDGTFVYWADHEGGTLNSVAVGGGSASSFATGQVHPLALAVDVNNAYWVAANGVYQFGGSAVTLLASGSPTSIAVDSSYVYWTDEGTQSQEGTVKRVPIGGGTVTTIATGQASPRGIFVSGSTVYWVNYGNGEVMSAAITGGGVVALAASQSGPTSLVVVGSKVYWTNYMGGELMSCATGGGSATVLAVGLTGADNLVSDGTRLFWSVSSYALAGVAPANVPMILTSLISSFSISVLVDATVNGLAVDTVNIYWTDPAAGTVNQLTK